MTDRLRTVGGVVIDGIRSALLRRPHGHAAQTGPGMFVAMLVLYAVIQLIIGFSTSDEPRMLSPWGINTLLADTLPTSAARESCWTSLPLSGHDVERQARSVEA